MFNDLFRSKGLEEADPLFIFPPAPPNLTHLALVVDDICDDVTIYQLITKPEKGNINLAKEVSAINIDFVKTKIFDFA